MIPDENDRLQIYNHWNTFQEQQLQHLKQFIDLENSLYEELDSLVLVSKDSSMDNEDLNILDALFHKNISVVDSPEVPPVPPVPEIPQVPEMTIVQKEQCNCKSTIQSLKNEIRSLKLSLKSKEAEKKDFIEFKKLELEKLESYKIQNLKEIKKEIRELEKLKKASAILPSKKERVEIENLKKLNLQAQEEFKQKEIRYLLAQDRFKRRIDELTKRNSELLEEVKVLERDRANYVNSKRKTLNFGIQTDIEPITQLIPCKEAVIALSSLAACLELSKPLDSVIHPNKKVEYVYEHVKLVWYPNGTLKENYYSGKQVIYFVNGDKKTILEDGCTLYWYAQPDILHTTLPDGLEVYEFSNGQIEKRHADGTLEIHFPDSTIKYVYADGEEKVFFPDGTVKTI